jgi:hypothetical protein
VFTTEKFSVDSIEFVTKMANNQGTTKDPGSGKVYRITAPKVRSAPFVSLLAHLNEAKALQAAYMVEHQLVFDIQSKETRVMVNATPSQYVATAEFTALLTASKAAQAAIKAYKLAHRDEFRSQTEGRIPVIHRTPAGGQGGPGVGRKRARGGRDSLGVGRS